MGKEVAHSAAIQRSFRTAGSLAADQLAGSSYCALLSLAVAVSAILSYASLDRRSPIAEEKRVGGPPGQTSMNWLFLRQPPPLSAVGRKRENRLLA
jgi:hypothetical protein